MKHFDKPLPRVLAYLPGGGGGGGVEDSDIFTHSRLRPFLGVQNLLISIFFGGIFMYIIFWGDFHVYIKIYKIKLNIYIYK